MTDAEKREAVTAILYASYSLDYTYAFLANLGGIRELKWLKALGSFGSPAIGAVGPAMAVMIVFLAAPDTQLEFLQQQFEVQGVTHHAAKGTNAVLIVGASKL